MEETALKGFVDQLDSVNNIEKEPPLKVFTDMNNIHWNGRTVWENTQPTFISKKRKAMVIAPRKTGHSSLKFAFAEATARYGDDWIWIEDMSRHPKNFLDEDDFWKFARETHYSNPESNEYRAAVMIQKDEIDPDAEYHDQYTFQQDDPKCETFLGTAFTSWRDRGFLGHSSQLYRPYILSEFFSDWKLYLVIREPWDRFVSGLITELDNGIYTPWFNNQQHLDEKMWKESYIRMKRLLLWNDAENLVLGYPHGPQTDHTFTLSGWKWNGQDIFDVADHFIGCVPQVEQYLNENNEQWDVDLDSIAEGSTMIKKFKDADLLPEEISTGEDATPNMWQHTNVTPPNRRSIVDEAIDSDDDLKPFFDACRKYVAEDHKSIEKNNFKFL